MIEKFRKADAKARQAVIEGVGKMAPKAKIGATPSQVVQAALKRTISTLTDGDIDLPIVPQTGDQLAPEAFTGLTAFQSLMEGLAANGVPEAKEYIIDAKLAAADDERLLEASQRVIAAGKDKALAMAVKRMPSAAEPTAQPAAPEAKPSMADEVTQAMTKE